MQPIMEPAGLVYIPKIVPAELSDRISTFLSDPEIWFRVSKSERARRVAHYGFKYSYSSGKASEPADPIPDLFQELADLVPARFNFTPEQVIVNEYLPGQGIAKHVDSPVYGPVIACFTFGAGAEMEFRRGEERYCVYTEPDSLYVMSGESRTQWTHEMRKRQSDSVAGVKIQRGKRISITFRTLNAAQ